MLVHKTNNDTFNNWNTLGKSATRINQEWTFLVHCAQPMPLGKGVGIVNRNLPPPPTPPTPKWLFLLLSDFFLLFFSPFSPFFLLFYSKFFCLAFLFILHLHALNAAHISLSVHETRGCCQCLASWKRTSKLTYKLVILKIKKMYP